MIIQITFWVIGEHIFSQESPLEEQATPQFGTLVGRKFIEFLGVGY